MRRLKRKSFLLKKNSSVFILTVVVSITLLLTYKIKNSRAAFTFTDSVVTTYHNLSAAAGAMGSLAEAPLNDYEEVCVYCHTPHGASSAINAPIWNRTINVGSYNLYDSPTMDSTTSRPGAVSLACLSCHDGTIAIDSIINMNGSGKYSPSQATSSDDSLNGFLDQWSASDETHMRLRGGAPTNGTGNGCLSCHTPGAGAEPGAPFIPGNLAAGLAERDFTVYGLGTDLTNDHPIGMAYPNPGGASPVLDPKFVEPTNSKGSGVNKITWIENSNIIASNPSMANDSDVKLWGQNATVECASCHNPHGTLRDDNTIIRPFLRVDNANSALCLTCHIK